MSEVLYFRCGWCGHPTDEKGYRLQHWTDETWIEEKAELVEGMCCIEEQYSEPQQYVTRDMAIDAGDLSLEGQPY